MQITLQAAKKQEPSARSITSRDSRVPWGISRFAGPRHKAASSARRGISLNSSRLKPAVPQYAPARKNTTTLTRKNAGKLFFGGSKRTASDAARSAGLGLRLNTVDVGS